MLNDELISSVAAAPVRVLRKGLSHLAQELVVGALGEIAHVVQQRKHTHRLLLARAQHIHNVSIKKKVVTIYKISLYKKECYTSLQKKKKKTHGEKTYVQIVREAMH